MRFIDLEIAGFGKLVNRKISFDENLTVVYGLNEAGKSTVHACMRAMLYGLPRARGAAAVNDEFSKYKPWKTRKYGAVLRFEDAGHVFKLTRNFANDPVGCTLYDETDGCEVEDPSLILEYALCGMTKKTFENTVSIGQLRTCTDPSMAAELSQYLVNLNTSGDKALSTGKAGEYLAEQKEKLRNELSPEASRTFAANAAEIKKLEEELAGSYIENEKEIRNEIYIVTNKLLENAEKRGQLKDETAGNEEIRTQINKYKRLANIVIIPAAFFLVITIIMAILANNNSFMEKATFSPGSYMIIGGLLFGLCLIVEIILRIVILVESKQIMEDEEEEITILDTEAEELNLKNQQLNEALQNQSISQDQTVIMINRLNELKDKNAQLQAVMAENDRINSEIEAIDLALSTMDELSATVSESFGYHLNEEASGYIRELTNGAYNSLCVDEELRVLINSDERMIPIDQLSAGTKEQVYLAVRLAVAKLMQGNMGELSPMPLIFDDSFVNYDDERIASAIKWIASTYAGQIVIFSCQFREIEILDDMEIKHINIKL